MMNDKPYVQSRAEALRTIAAVVQLLLSLATLLLLIAVHFL